MTESGNTYWPDDAKETAFEVWAFVTGQNATKAADVLRSEWELPIPARTIQDWSKRYEWLEQHRYHRRN